MIYNTLCKLVSWRLGVKSSFLLFGAGSSLKFKVYPTQRSEGGLKVKSWQWAIWIWKV